MIKKAVLVILLAVFVWIIFVDTHKICILQVGNAKVINPKRNIVFVFENFYHPELRKLRKKEKLDSKVASAKTEFQKILLLRDWANKQWKMGLPFPYPPFNANIILKEIRSGVTGGWCGQYGVVFAQACMSFGIPVRYLEIMPEGNGGHFVTEVYSRDYKKWVLVDPTLDLVYEEHKIPLNVLELHNLTVNKKEKITSISSSGNTRNPDIGSYFSFVLWLRNNHLSIPLNITTESNPVENVTITRLHDNRMWYDDKQHLTKLLIKQIEPKVQVISSNPKDFYWEPDIVVIRVLKKNRFNKTVSLEFKGLTKNYSTFQVSFDKRKSWHEAGSIYNWQLHSGLNMLEVTAPDKNGLNERSSYIIARLGS